MIILYISRHLLSLSSSSLVLNYQRQLCNSIQTLSYLGIEHTIQVSSKYYAPRGACYTFDMTLDVVTNVLAVIGGGLVFTGFQDSLMPRASAFDPKHGDSAIRVAVALDGGKPGSKHFDPQGADGRAPGVLVYNPVYNYVGHSDWKHRPHIASGSYTDLTIYQEEGPGQQAPWVQLYAGDDAICVAYVSQRMSDGTGLGWLGDMGRACGQDWYHSNVVLEGSDRSPDCVWLNHDHARDKTSTGSAAVQINMMVIDTYDYLVM